MSESGSVSDEQTREIVREGYAKIAGRQPSCCGESSENKVAQAIGYSDADIEAVPEGSNLGVGCGNPVSFAAPRPGESVLDLGSGAGFDVFIAARAVGPKGRAVGVDMTDEMLERARANAESAGFDNVSFHKGLIEKLPFEDASFDIVISNCVINLAPDKDRVFREIYRVLRPGGRMAVSDLVLEKELPPAVARSAEAYVGCIAGAMLRSDYVAAIERAGLSDVNEVEVTSYGDILLGLQAEDLDGAIAREGLTLEEAQDAAASISSLKVTARR